MRIKINGKAIDSVQRLEVRSSEFSNAAAWGVVLLGTLAAIGWWKLWQ